MRRQKEKRVNVTGGYSKPDLSVVSELEEAWDLVLAEARERARASGRQDIAGYIDLRRRNDLLRRTAADWLLNAAVSLAAKANRHGAGIQIEQDNAHRFKRGSATMVGTRLTLRRGVRALTIESGWPRTPRDGIVRGGGLACANIKHFGRRRDDAELLLVSSGDGAPRWLILEKNADQAPLTEARLLDHFSRLLRDT